MEYPKDLCKKILFSKEEIEKRAKELAQTINKEYENEENVTFVCTLKGAIPFFATLMNYINLYCDYEVIKASSYAGTQTTNVVNLSKIKDFPIKDKHIIIVEDIVDTGLTADAMISFFKNEGASSVKMLTLLNKQERREVNVSPEYIGFEVANEFVIGYGLDYNEKYRNLPYIGVINEKYI